MGTALYLDYEVKILACANSTEELFRIELPCTTRLVVHVSELSDIRS